MDKLQYTIFESFPDVLAIEELCSALNIGKNTAYQLINSGKIKSIRIGKIHKIPKVWLVEYVMKEAL